MQLACIRHCLFITQPSNTSQRLFIVQPSIIPLLLRLALWVRFHFSTIVCKVEFSECGHRDVDRHRARGHGGFARRLHQKHGGPSTCPRALLHRSTTHNTDALILLFFPTIRSFHQFFFTEISVRISCSLLLIYLYLLNSTILIVTLFSLVV